MTSLTVERAERTFKFNGIPLQDPDIKMTPQQVKDFYAGIYPELTNAEIEGPEMKGAVAHYEFRKAVGTKGDGSGPAPTEKPSLLEIINRRMHEGKCPKPGAMGECAIIFNEKAYGKNAFIAMLYIWDEQFNDSETVANWFKAEGAQEITITHTLYSDINGDRNGVCGDISNSKAREWMVRFLLPINATQPSDDRAIKSAILVADSNETQH